MRKLLIAAALIGIVPSSAMADGLGDLLLGFISSKPSAPSTPKLPEGTHEASRAITVKSDSKKLKLQTFAVGADSNIYALLASDRYGDKVDRAEIQVFDSEGKKLRSWKLDFPAQSINCTNDNLVFAAGNGQLAVFDLEGTVKKEPGALPFIDQVLANKEKLREKAEQQRDSEVQSYEETLKQFKEQLEELNKVEEDDRTRAQTRQIKQLESTVKAYDRMLKQAKEKDVDHYAKQIAGQIKNINAVVANDTDVFIVCGEMKGYGYAVWRMGRNFEDPKQIMSGLRGCCGQMDIQCCGDDLIVAQNCEHNVGRYNRDGKKLGTFGKRADRDGTDGCFGGCCNPMNVRAGADGRVFTAESEGIVRVFDKDGKPEGVVAGVTLSGGCKNVAVGVSKNGETVYLCDLPGSKIHVLTRKTSTAKNGD